jgi:hypothetical protein
VAVVANAGGVVPVAVNSALDAVGGVDLEVSFETGAGGAGQSLIFATGDYCIALIIVVGLVGATEETG